MSEIRTNEMPRSEVLYWTNPACGAFIKGLWHDAARNADGETASANNPNATQP
jgi:hypothetical protein